MGLDVDEAGRNREPRRVDDPGRLAGKRRRDGGDAAIGDRHIGDATPGLPLPSNTVPPRIRISLVMRIYGAAPRACLQR